MCLGVYTSEEKEFNKRSCLIGPDVQIPNSIVRQRLGTNQMMIKVNMENLRKAFELPADLLLHYFTLENTIGQVAARFRCFRCGMRGARVEARYIGPVGDGR